ncbi:MAG TPA: FAD binding domain-containing protein [Steroidobacteraceae bacterium]
MKAADFLYHRATSIGDAVRYLDDYGGSARVLAGGQSLMPMLNMRLWRPAALIDINAVPDIANVQARGEETVLGAMVRHVTIETSPIVAARLPLLALMIRSVGDRQIRNRGTLGGSLVQGDPSAEMPLACLVLDAGPTVVGRRGSREIRMDAFYEGSYAAALTPDELLTQIAFPKHPPHFAFREVCRRHNDFATVAVAATGYRDADGCWRRIRLGLGGVHDVPMLASRAMALLDGSRLTDADIAAAASEAPRSVAPLSDMRATETYRRHLLAVYVRRVLTDLRSSAAT